MDYEIVLGLEVHLQLNTKKKMFCGCKNDPFDSKPNTNVCPVCLGLPGALPVPNKEAIKSAQRMAYALGTKLSDHIIFERKNYFYPDLPKGFQLTCPHDPIGKGGELDMSYWKENTKIRFREVHLEEDTAKSMHEKIETLIDFNKSGVPLLEMVTEPDIHDIDLAVSFCKEIQLIARYLNVSEASMQKGHMRLEANISLRKPGEVKLPDYRVELKNINSFNFMKKALQHEVERQTRELDAGNILTQETRGYDEQNGVTFTQRTKEEANDYRYFPEPDLPLIIFNEDWLEEIVQSVTKTPSMVRDELVNKGLKKEYLEILVENQELQEKLTSLSTLGYEPNRAANLIINETSYKGLSVEKIHQIETEKKRDKVSSEDDLEPIVEKVISQNPKALEDYKNGNENSLQFLIGQIMRETKGKADAEIARKILLTRIN